MKKILCLVLAFVMLSTTAFASVDDLYEAMQKRPQSADYSYDISFTLDKPLTFLKEIIDPQQFNPVDMQMLIEGILDSKMTANVKFTSSDDFKASKIYLNLIFDVPVSLNDSFKSTNNVHISMWIDYDLTSETPVYKMILKHPFSNKYMYIDLMQFMPYGFEGMNAQITTEKTEEINKKAIDLYKKYCEVTKTNDTYTLKISDENFKKMFVEILEIMNDIVNESNSLFAGENVDYAKQLYNMYDDVILRLKKLENVQILGEDGLTFSYKINKNKEIESGNEKLSIDLNIREILKALELDYLDCPENIDIAFSMISWFNAKYDDVTIEFPILEEDNYIDIADLTNNEYIYTGDSIWIDYEVSNPPVDGALYVPVKTVFNEYGVEEENIIYEPGKITVKLDSDYQSVKEVIVYSDLNKITVDGTDYTLEGASYEKDGEIYVTSDFLTYLGAAVYRKSATKDTDYENWYVSASISFENRYKDFDYDYEEENPVISDEDYIDNDLWLYSVHPLVYKHDEVYVPLNEFLEVIKIEYDDILIDGSSVTINTDNKFLPVENVSFNVGESAAIVDGALYDLGKETVLKDEVIYVPQKFTQIFNCTVEITEVSTYGIQAGDEVSYTFSFNYEYPQDLKIPGSIFVQTETEEEFIYENGELYIPLMKLLENYYVTREDVNFDNGTLTINFNEGLFDFNKIVVSNNSSKITVDNTEFDLGKNVIIRNGITFVPQAFTGCLNSSVDTFSIRRTNNVWIAAFYINYIGE